MEALVGFSFPFIGFPGRNNADEIGVTLAMAHQYQAVSIAHSKEDKAILIRGMIGVGDY